MENSRLYKCACVSSEDRRDRLEEQNERLQSDAASLEKEIAYLRQLWQELHGKLQTL